MVYRNLELHPFIYQQGKMQDSQVQDPESTSKSGTLHHLLILITIPKVPAWIKMAVFRKTVVAVTTNTGSYQAQWNPSSGYQNQGMPNGSYQQSAPMAPANGQYQPVPNRNIQPQNNYQRPGSYQGMPNYAVCLLDSHMRVSALFPNRWQTSCPSDNSERTLC